MRMVMKNLINKHNEKFKKKGKVAGLPSSACENAPINESNHLKTSSMEMLNKVDITNKNRLTKEEIKIDDSVNFCRPEPTNRQKEGFYASTDIRTSASVDPTFSILRHTNNFINDEHISITHRLREINNSISNNESIIQINNNESNIMGSLNDKDAYLLQRPKRSITTEYEEMASPQVNKNRKFYKPTDNQMYPYIRNRNLLKPNEQGFMKSFESKDIKSQFEEVKELNEDDYECQRDIANNSINSERVLKISKEEEKEERKVETKLLEYDNDKDTRFKHTSLSLFPIEVTKNHEPNKFDFRTDQNLNNIKLKNNYINQSFDSEAKEDANKIPNFNEGSNKIGLKNHFHQRSKSQLDSGR